MIVRHLLPVIISALLAAITAHTQESEPALGRIHYEFIHINDTLQPDKPHKEEMVLYLGQHATLYGSYVAQRMQQQIRKQMEDVAFDGNLTITGSGRSTPESYYAHASTQQFTLLYGLGGNRYLVDEDYPAIDWEIIDETKEIGGYTVQQAIGQFKGRTYTAWFTTELPFTGGPWKLQGLPGLVLEAYDRGEEVQFRYAGFEKPEEEEATVSLPQNAVRTTRKALDKLIEAFQKNPQAARSARSQGASTEGSGAISVGGSSSSSGGAMDMSRIKSVNVKRDVSQTSSVVNNPLELEN